MIVLEPRKHGQAEPWALLRPYSLVTGRPVSATHATDGLAITYVRDGGEPVPVTPAAPGVGHVVGAVVPLGAGLVRVLLPAAAAASGTTGVTVNATATDVGFTPCRIPLIAVDPHDGMRMGLAAIPNSTHSAGGGLLTSGTGAGQLSTSLGGVAVASVTAVLPAIVAAVWARLLSSMTEPGSIGERLASSVTSEQFTSAVDDLATSDQVDAARMAIMDLLAADRYVDTSTVPWSLVLIKQGTGTLHSETAVELLRQEYFGVDGQPVTSAKMPRGRAVAHME